MAGTRPEASPRNWTVREGAVPIEVAGLAGELRPDPAALDLWGYRAAAPTAMAWRQGLVEVDARIPDGAELAVRFGARMPDHGGDRVDDAPAMSDRPPPKTPQGPAEIGVVVRFDRLRHRTRVSGLPCEDGPDVGPEPKLAIRVAATRIEVEADGRPITRCDLRQSLDGAPIFESTVRRVQISRAVFTPDGAEPWTASFGGPLRGPAGGLLGAGLGALLGALLPRGWVLAPGLLAGLALLSRWRETLDAWRLLALPEAVAPLLLGGLPAGLLAIGVAARHSLVGAVAAGLLPALVAAAGFAFGAPDALGWVLLALVAFPVAFAAHGSRRRWHPLLLQALLFSAFPLVELGLRHTAQDGSWSHTAGFTRAQEEIRELVELRRHRDYPSEGFPVKPPEKGSRRRIVALGGSSTGGAYQMDDIDLFWPRRLEQQLGGWEVVNQGVGGWNTEHIRVYVETQIERLAPDVLVLYVGHNDALTLTSVPFREHLQNYQASRAPHPVRDALRGLRLYNGLKYALLALREEGGAVTVPMDYARENHEAVAAAAAAHGARVLFVTEGLNPDPTPLDRYAEMQAEVARATGNRHLDARAALFARDEPRDFLDDCHLSEAGHIALATMIAGALREADFL